MDNFPVDFEAKARGAKPPNGAGYPVQISAGDLMRNFVFGALDAAPSLIETTTGQGGHTARRLKIPAAPSSGTHVLGAVDGALQWIATEKC
jgi:hypothetical protein